MKMTLFIIIILSIITKSICYQNPYQILKVGPFHSLSYVYKAYLDLINSINQTNTSDIAQRLDTIRRAYLEIKVSRYRETEEGEDELFLGLMKVGKQCTIAIIIFYIGLSVVYYLLKIAYFILQEIYLFLIMNIVIFHILQTFFIPIIQNMKIQYIITVILSISVVIFRYYSKKKEKDSENIQRYEQFSDLPDSIKAIN